MMAPESLTWTAALIVGLIGSVHCVPMCGGIAGALGQMSGRADPRSMLRRSGLYSAGRVSSYSLVGAMAGAAGHSLEAMSGSGPTLRILAGLMIVALGLQMSGWWKGSDVLQRMGLKFWRRLMPLARRIGPANRAWRIFAIGMLWGWLPCGLVYSTLAVASTTGSAASGALFMFSFGIGTLPAMLLTSSLSGMLKGVTERFAVRQAAAGLLLAFGAWTLFAATMGNHGHDESKGRPHHETMSDHDTRVMTPHVEERSTTDTHPHASRAM